MRTPARLPARLGDRFTVAEAGRAGVGRSRRDAPDLHRPFHGVRTREVPAEFQDLVDAYAKRMRPAHRFAGRTAMRLWGLPLPAPWRLREALIVAVPPNAAPPRTPGVEGRRLDARRSDTFVLKGVRVVDPIAALFGTAAELDEVAIVSAIDALITTSFDYPGLGPGRPMTTLDAIRDRLRAWGRFPGCTSVRAALALAREKVESPKETETRLLIVRAGLPEPVVQFEVRDGGRLVARIDLAYPDLKIAIEYEGDEHRVDKNRWRHDIRRQRELESRGWIVIRLTQADLADDGALLLRVLRAALSARRP